MKISDDRLKEIMANATRYDETDAQIRALCREVLAARSLRDEINSYSQGMSLLCEEAFGHCTRIYDAAREGKE